MTTIAARRLTPFCWVIAADTQETREGEDAGDMKRTCQKIFRFKSAIHDGNEIICATAGESSPGLAFMRWLELGGDYPEWLRTHDIAILVMSPVNGKAVLFEYDQFGEAATVLEDRAAIGTGAMAALVAMDFGATAEQAVKAAHKYDPYTGPEVLTASLAVTHY